MDENKSGKDEAECCPKFDPAPWDQKELTWNNKKFVKDAVTAFFHIPLNMGSVVSRMWEKVEGAGAKTDTKDFLMLSNDPTPWRSDQYIAVAKEVPGMENVTMSGKFLTKVFEGPFKEAKNWVDEMKAYVESKGKEMKDLYFYYTTCPKCAEKYGKNYVVAFAKVG